MVFKDRKLLSRARTETRCILCWSRLKNSLALHVCLIKNTADKNFRFRNAGIYGKKKNLKFKLESFHRGC